MYIRLICLRLFSLFFLCSLPSLCPRSSSPVTPTLFLLTSKDFIHASTYISSALSLFVNQSELKLAYLFSLPLFSSQHIYLTFSLLNPPPQPTIYNGTAFHKCHSKTSFMFGDSSVHARARAPSTLRPLPPVKDCCFRIWPRTSAAKGCFIVMHM